MSALCNALFMRRINLLVCCYVSEDGFMLITGQLGGALISCNLFAILVLFGIPDNFHFIQFRCFLFIIMDFFYFDIKRCWRCILTPSRDLAYIEGAAPINPISVQLLH
jgi:hypothetical protein